MNHLLILPILLPMLMGAVLLVAHRMGKPAQRVLSLLPGGALAPRMGDTGAVVEELNLMGVQAVGMGLGTLIRRMGRGLLVTELMGHGLNMVTGDYSRGAAGFWVENGEIQFAVQEVTIAGNMRDMFKQIVAVGNDLELRSNIRTGSVLIERMTVAGS